MKVIDYDGKPIKGAVLVPDLRRKASSTESNDQGWAVLSDWDGSAVYVVAPHYKMEFVRGEHGSGTPTIVKLHKSNRVQIAPTNSNGHPLDAAIVLVTTESEGLYGESGSTPE